MGRRFLGEAKKVKLQLYATPEDMAVVKGIAAQKGKRVGEVTGKLFHLGIKRYQQLKERSDEKGSSSSNRRDVRQIGSGKHPSGDRLEPNSGDVNKVSPLLLKRIARNPRLKDTTSGGASIRHQEPEDE